MGLVIASTGVGRSIRVARNNHIISILIVTISADFFILV
jgi:hypothetical protein